MRRIGLYPGTFDPVTNGHLDIMQRATHVVDHLIIAVANSPGKNPAFTPPERVQLLQDLVAENDFGSCTRSGGVKAGFLPGLLATAIIR